MALTLSVVALGDGTLLATANGMSASGRSVTFRDTTTAGSGDGTVNTGGASQQSHQFMAAPLGQAQTITATVYSSTGGTGSVLQSASAIIVGSVTPPTVTASTSGSYSGCSWASAPSGMDNTTYTYQFTDLWYSVNGGTRTYYGRQTTPSGTIPATAVYVGPGVTVTWTAQTTYYRAASPANFYATNGGSGSATTAGGGGGGTPPAAPGNVTGLGATDHTSNIALAWTAPAGGATGYQVSRDGTVVTTTTATSYTDNSPSGSRPTTYTVKAYNSNAFGTSYASGVSVTVAAAGTSQRLRMTV